MLRILKSSKAAIDLASIMVGVVVLTVIAGVIAATVFAVIPWVENENAKQQVQAVNTAQAAYAGIEISNSSASLTAAALPVYAAAPEGAVYGDLEDLVNGGFLNVTVDPDNPTLNVEGTICVVTTDNGEGYRTEVVTPSGEIYYSTNVDNATLPLPADQDPLCFPQAPAEEDTNPPAEEENETPAIATANVTACDGTYCDFGTYKGAYPGFRLLITNLNVPTTSTTPTDWEFRIDRFSYPFTILSDDEILNNVVTDGGVDVRLDGSDIVVYNTQPYRQITATSNIPGSVTVWFDYSENVPHRTAVETTNTGPQNLNASTSQVYADVNITLADVYEPLFGSWETEIDIANMVDAIPQNFDRVELNTAYANAGMTLTPISGTRYLLSYNPNPADTADWAWGLKGAAVVNPTNYTQGLISLPSSLIVYGDGTSKSTVTLTATNTPNNPGWPNQSFRITGATAGSWSATVDLTDLDNFTTRPVPRVTAGNYTMTHVSGSTWQVNFTGSWDVNNQTITIYMSNS